MVYYYTLVQTRVSLWSQLHFQWINCLHHNFSPLIVKNPYAAERILWTQFRGLYPSSMLTGFNSTFSTSGKAPQKLILYKCNGQGSSMH